MTFDKLLRQICDIFPSGCWLSQKPVQASSTCWLNTSPEFSTPPCWHSYGFHFCSWPNAQHCSSGKASTWIAYFFLLSVSHGFWCQFCFRKKLHCSVFQEYICLSSQQHSHLQVTVLLTTSVVHVFHSRERTSSAQLLCYYFGISPCMAVPTQYLIAADFYPDIWCALCYVDIAKSFCLESQQ